MGFVMDKVALANVSSERFCFPCRFSSHQMSDTIIDQLVADVQIGRMNATKFKKKKPK
jgi:hypothetical protein